MDFILIICIVISIVNAEMPTEISGIKTSENSTEARGTLSSLIIQHKSRHGLSVIVLPSRSQLNQEPKVYFFPANSTAPEEPTNSYSDMSDLQLNQTEENAISPVSLELPRKDNDVGFSKMEIPTETPSISDLLVTLKLRHTIVKMNGNYSKTVYYGVGHDT